MLIYNNNRYFYHIIDTRVIFSQIDVKNEEKPDVNTAENVNANAAKHDVKAA